MSYAITSKGNKARMKAILKIEDSKALDLFIKLETMEAESRESALLHKKYSCDSARHIAVANSLNLVQDLLFEAFVIGAKRKERRQDNG